MTASMKTIPHMAGRTGAGDGMAAHTATIIMSIIKYLDEREDSG